MSAYDDQLMMFERVLKDAELLTSDANQLKHLGSFLDAISSRVKPCRAQLINSKVGVRWEWDTGYVSVLFGSDDSWEWISESASCFGGCKEYIFDKKYSFSGGSSYTSKSIRGPIYGPIYWLPEEVLNLIKVPDTFEGTYEPMIEKHNYDVVWETSRYDGMLAGYCQYKGKLHLFEHVEETEFERHRMFAVFELPFLERITVWWRYHAWHTTLYNHVLWNMHTYVWRMGMRWNTFFKRHDKTYEERFAKLKKTHKIVGYFQG